ncbi:MAG: hypothetical protein F9K44_04180 [Hyphomicrobiaceae bacterium]|jgi:hypothetical protein|nr:MAG: hypothetical protein F9K44_04180 [Hyphomicrobiaceae bacterium]
MNINRTAISVVLPAIFAMLLALLVSTRSASAQSTQKPPPAQQTSKPVPPSNAVKLPPRKETHDVKEEALRPFQSTRSLKVIRYGRASRAYY